MWIVILDLFLPQLWVSLPVNHKSIRFRWYDHHIVKKKLAEGWVAGICYHGKWLTTSAQSSWRKVRFNGHLGRGSFIISTSNQVCSVSPVSHGWKNPTPGRTLFPAHHNQECRVCYRRVTYIHINIFKNYTNKKLLHIVIAVAQSCRLPREMIWSLCKENSL